MATLTAKFDGKAFVPDTKIDIPVGTTATVTVPERLPEMRPNAIEELLAWLKRNPGDPETAKEFTEIIDREFSRIDPREW
jgi:hypothetical protein